MNGNGEGGAVGKEAINTDIVTLTRFLTEEQAKHKEATGDFTYVAASRPMQTPLTIGSAVCCVTPCSSPSRAFHTTSDGRR